MRKIVVHRRAANYLRRLPDHHKTKIKAELEKLKESPFNMDKIRKMHGEWAGYHRMRIGDFRVIFLHDEENDMIYVDHIGPRGDIYKR